MQQIQDQPEPAQDVWFSTAEYYEAIVKLGKSMIPGPGESWPRGVPHCFVEILG